MTHARVRTYADIEAIEREWLWKGYISAADLTLVAGMGGIGKGFLFCDLVARVTKGTPMPDGTESDVPAGSVVMFSYEDDPNLTMRKRLNGAGADVSKVIPGWDDFSIPSGLPKLAAYCDRIGDVRMVTIDPLASATELNGLERCGPVQLRRNLMQPLMDFGRKTGIAVVPIHHMNKDGKTISGGKAITDTARSVLMITRNPNNPDIRMIGTYKANETKAPASLGYDIVDDPPRVQYITLDGDLLDANGPNTDRSPSVQTRVLGALQAADGPLDVQTIMRLASADHLGTRVALSRLKDQGDIDNPRRGIWQIPPDDGPTGLSLVNSD